MASALQGAIEFLRDFGLFDIVLPFVFVFTIIFAVLEKTRVLGVESDNSPKKNVDAMVAFVIAFLVVATNQIVNAINKILPNIVLLLVLSLSFLILIGIFMKTGELDLSEKHRGLYLIFVLIMFVGVIIIFLNSLEYNGNTWLAIAFDYLINNFKSPVVTTVILLIVVVAALYFITKGPKPQSNPGNGG